jgi:uncharacterized spore protein YtfJ
MPLNRLFDVVERTHDAAHWRAAFGEPQQVGDRTIIPVAQTGQAFGLGFGGDIDLPESEGNGGAGGGASIRPVGAIVVTPDEVYFQETADTTVLAVAGIGLAVLFLAQLASVVRILLGKK